MAMWSSKARGSLLNASTQMGRPATKLIASYLFDWIIIIVFAAAGGALSFVKPHHRPFSLLNTDISYPYVEEQITTWMLAVIAFVAPGIIIAIITLVFVPGKDVRRISNRSQIMRLKLWELEKGLAGLCLSVAVAFFITQGMKNMFGKPRPNLLARCMPDLTDVAAHVVGGFGQDISPRWALVDASICTQTDHAKLDDGFRSFPSGHSSWSWSGLLYLTLYFCSKFAIAIPHLPVLSRTTAGAGASARKGTPTADHELLPLHAHRARGASEETKREPADFYPGDAATLAAAANPLVLRNEAAAPPNYLILPALTPVAVAVYVCSTRFAEFYHFGFDIIFGSLIGIATAYLAFRWYHLPISRGQGWAWGSRSKDRAWAIGVGTGGYVGDEGTQRLPASGTDVEAGRA